jgi:DMSO reductase iron-sulfur subunit
VPNSFVFDPNRCTGCGACQLACSIENQLGPERSWRRIETFNPRHYPSVPLYHLSLACNHCDEPACMYACPALAYSRDKETGAVILDEAKCIGCKYCSWACPYDAPVFDQARGVMSKCTFCNHRLQDGLKPACAALCPTAALDFAHVPEAELNNAIDGFPESDLRPRIQIQPLVPGRRLPVMTAPEVATPFAGAQQPAPSEISLESEWSLMAFTSAAAALVALVASSLRDVAVSPSAFAVGAAITVGLAMLHLGKVGRAYRAFFNLRRSWLSREVLTLSAFFGLGTLYLWLAPGNAVLGGAATLVGFLALLCADRVYSVLKASEPAHRHSASVLWTGFFLTGVFTGTAWLAAGCGFGKRALYVLRKLSFIDSGKPVRPMVTALRTGVGLLLPSVLWYLDFGQLRTLIIICVLIGELIDRAEYYEELQTESPARQMELRLSARVVAASEPVEA